jgi:hypothetical protein
LDTNSFRQQREASESEAQTDPRRQKVVIIRLKETVQNSITARFMAKRVLGKINRFVMEVERSS